MSCHQALCTYTDLFWITNLTLAACLGFILSEGPQATREAWRLFRQRLQEKQNGS